MDNKTRIRAFLDIRGFSAKPEKITEALGIEPDETWEEGDINPNYPPKGLLYKGPIPVRRKFSCWKVISHLADDASYDTEDYIKDIIRIISPAKNKIQELPKEVNLVLGVWVDISSQTAMPALGLEADTMRFLASINADLDIDLSLIPDEPSADGNA